MIIEKLMLVEFTSERNIRLEYEKLKAAKNLLKLLKQVDFTVEEVPTVDANRLIRLLVSLKGELLNSEETNLVNEIVSNNTIIVSS